MAANSLNLLVSTILLFLFAKTTAELPVYFIDHECGSNMNDSRITCQYQTSGTYKTQIIYTNVEMVTFGRFTNAILDCRKFPNIRWLVVESVINDPCEHVILSPSQSVIVQWYDDHQGSGKRTCTGKEQPSTHTEETDTAAVTTDTAIKSGNYAESLTSIEAIPTSRTENYAESITRVDTTPTRQTENYAESITRVDTTPTRQTEIYTKLTASARTIITSQTENYAELSSSDHESETDDYKIFTLSLGVGLGGTVAVLIIAIICHRCGILNLKSIQFGILQIDISDINRSGLGKPIMNSTSLSQSSTTFSQPNTTVSQLSSEPNPVFSREQDVEPSTIVIMEHAMEPNPECSREPDIESNPECSREPDIESNPECSREPDMESNPECSKEPKIEPRYFTRFQKRLM